MTVDLNKITKKLKEKFGSASVVTNIEDPYDFVSTGNLAFDLISDGGIPFGYCIEFLGLSQSGKSLFIQQIIANAQKKYDAIGILADRENAYFKGRGEQLGINSDKLMIVKPADIPTIPYAFEFILDSVKGIREQDKDSYIVIGIDSISSFGKDVALHKADPGRKAKAVHEGLREVLTLIDNRVILLVCNQVTYKIGVMFGDPKTTTAGESMKYYSTVRFSLKDERRITDEKRGNEVIGSWLGVEVIKTRLGPCYRACHIPFSYKAGIPYYGGYARLLGDRNYLTPKNKQEFKTMKSHSLTYKDKEKVNEFEIESFLKDHPELLFDTYPEYLM